MLNISFSGVRPAYKLSAAQNAEMLKGTRRKSKSNNTSVCGIRRNYVVSSPVSLDQRLKFIADRWMAETINSSSMDEIISNDHYREIINIGSPAVSWILKDLRDSPKHWFTALYIITGADPVAEADAGDFDAMTEAWINWGKANGFV